MVFGDGQPNGVIKSVIAQFVYKTMRLTASTGVDSRSLIPVKQTA